jgi:hypothetical protein
MTLASVAQRGAVWLIHSTAESALQALAVKTMSKKVPTFVMARSPDNDALIEAAGRVRLSSVSRCSTRN